MANKTYAVLGATGKIGHVLTGELLKKGHKVRAIGRDGKKLGGLMDQGAEFVTAAFDDAAQLARAFEGADAAFVMIPPHYAAEDFGAYQDKAGEAIREALVRSKVKKALNLSSIGAQHAGKTGPIKGLHRQEARLDTLPGVDVLHLRPCTFMQNYYFAIQTIQQSGTVYSAVKSDLPQWQVSTDDIGRKAAELLAAPTFKGKGVFDFVGPKQLTQAEAVASLSKAIGKPVKYVQLSYEDMEKALLGAGMKPSIVSLMVEMYRAANEGLLKTTQTLTPKHKGATAFEDFARDFAKLLAGSRPALAKR